MNAFLLDWMQQLTGTLNRVCLFGIVEWRWPRLTDSPGFVELWVLAWAIVGWLALLCANPSFLFLIPTILRVWEIFWRHLNLLVNDRQNRNLTKPLLTIINRRRSVLLALLNYVEIVVWFAVVYRAAWLDLETKGLLRTS